VTARTSRDARDNDAGGGQDGHRAEDYFHGMMFKCNTQLRRMKNEGNGCRLISGLGISPSGVKVQRDVTVDVIHGRVGTIDTVEHAMTTRP